MLEDSRARSPDTTDAASNARATAGARISAASPASERLRYEPAQNGVRGAGYLGGWMMPLNLQKVLLA
jgi:hypothetical protein